MVKCVDDDREDEVRAGRVLIHRCAGCFPLSNTKVVDFFGLLEGCQLALLNIVYVDHAGVWVLTQLEPWLV